ncbi:response regulator [Gordonia sp. LUNF6]|uniref:Putative two-component response regulator n=1 Tax=Gordonia sihwensis NBRC 108236 TaxID=1223544 RepID=L7LI83_9ACTN|nr:MULTISPECIES: response regulator transcription factor [Gordonia]WFN91875.1 response regulator transcription factor [Gordonia sihwensis]GAC60441.1 putative two-component response regulator [Gordonia sihwensis NBRC 108236]
MSRTRVVLADDHAAVREGLRLVLESSGEISVVGEASNGADAVDAAERLRPDVVVMDVRMPGTDGIAATAEVMARTDAAVLVLTTFDIDEYVLGSLAAGASGFLLKSASGAELVDGVRRVAQGDAVLDPAVTRVVVDAMRSRPAEPAPDLSDLTEREIEVLGGLGAGLSNAQIARRLMIGEATVKTHVSRVLMKLGVQSRVQAAVLAARSGIEL